MEKSIKSIWEQGLSNEGILVPPKVEQLYSRKSIHIIDRFKSGFRINMIAILVVAVIVLAVSILVDVVYAGLTIFCTLVYVAWSAKKDYESIQYVDRGQNSYSYLMSFKEWMNFFIEKYGLIYRFVYPILILAFYLGLWFSSYMLAAREHLADSLQWGVYMPVTIGVVILAGTMSVLSKRIHRRDVNLVYGGLLQQLDQLISDLEELRE